MRIKRRNLLIALLVALTTVLYIAYHPLKWNGRIVGLTRSDLHQRLGTPTEDMFELKGLEVYERRTIIGRWIFLIAYDPLSASATPKGSDSTRVARAQKVLHLGSRNRYFPISFSVIDK